MSQTHLTPLRTSFQICSIWILNDLSKRLKVTFNNSIHKDTCFFCSIPMRYINNVRFDNYGRPWALIGVECGNRSVIHQAVVPAYDTEADDVAFLIKDLKSLHAVSSW